MRASTALFAFLLAFLPAPAGRGAEAGSFRVKTLEIGGKLLDTALVRPSGSGPGTLVVAFLGGQGGARLRRIALFRLPGLERTGEIPVPRDAVLYDVADVTPAPGPELVFLQPDGVLAQELGPKGFEGAPVRLVQARSFFDRPQHDALHRAVLCPDLTGDGAPDLLIPQHYGYLAAVRGEGGFERFFTLSLAGRNRMVRMTHEVFQTDFLAQNLSLPVLRAVDFDGDGKTDLVGLRSRSLVGFTGKGSDGFAAKPSFDVALPTLAASTDEPEEDVFEGRRVFLEEVNGDGRIDLVAVKTQGKVGLFSSIRTRFELFLGREGAFFAPFPDRILTVPGVGTFPKFVDLDGDGRLDLVVPALRTDILSGAKTVLVKEVTLSYYLFAAGDQGLWETEPAFRESAELPVGEIEAGRAVPGAVFDGDFDGDGRRDRVVFEKEAVRIYPGVPGTRFRFSEEPRWSFPAEVSNDFKVMDVDGDGASDLLFYHPDKVVVALSGP